MNTVESMIRRDVLIVEDEMDVRAMLFDALDEAEYFVMDVSSAEEAMFIMESIKPSLVILDVNLRGKSGWDVLEWMREREATKDIPAIVMSGAMEAGAMFKALNPEKSKFIQKPFGIEFLLSVMEDMLEAMETGSMSAAV